MPVPTVHLDPSTSEPYLLLMSARFPPNTEIRLTPVRPSDADRLKHVYNQPEIGKRLYSTPWPYLPTDAQNSIKSWTADLPPPTSLFFSSSSRPSPSLAACPFHCIRIYPTSSSPSSSETPEPIPSSGGLLIGTMGVHPDRTGAPGVCDLGYVLMKEYAGRGVVGMCVEAIMRLWEGWGAQDERVKKWQAYVETDNPGSLRLLEKLGFVVVEVDPRNAWPEVKGGGFRECARLERGRMDGGE